MPSKLLNREEGVVPALSIVIVSMAAAIFYGLVHDQIKRLHQWEGRAVKLVIERSFGVREWRLCGTLALDCRFVGGVSQFLVVGSAKSKAEARCAPLPHSQKRLSEGHFH